VAISNWRLVMRVEAAAETKSLGTGREQEKGKEE
jgi:hypothetical protein